MYIENVHRLHKTSRDKLVWRLKGRFIGYTGLVVIPYSGVYREVNRLHRTSRDKLVWCLRRGFICYTGIVVIN